MLKSLLLIFVTAATAAFALDAGDHAAEFKLSDPSGKEFKLADYAGKNVVVIFMATKCPYSNAFNQVMAKLAADYNAKGVTVLGINSNKAEAAEEVAEHAKQHGISFPVLKDPGNKVADLYGAQVTPEAFVIDGKGAIRYHGALGSSNNPTTDASKANSDEIRAALDALLGGKEIAKVKTKAFGCSIKRAG